MKIIMMMTFCLVALLIASFLVTDNTVSLSEEGITGQFANGGENGDPTPLPPNPPPPPPPGSCNSVNLV
ncbi:MAG: hypothetical protein ACOY90_11910 [Candidatus Zhuqueibacterota bacterium]